MDAKRLGMFTITTHCKTMYFYVLRRLELRKMVLARVFYDFICCSMQFGLAPRMMFENYVALSGFPLQWRRWGQAV